MSLAQIFAWSGGGLFLLLTLVQLAPIRPDPWSAIARWVGRAVNSHRDKILQFNNELLRSIDHTKEEFIEVLAEINAYERFCGGYPDYPNNRAVLAIENIRENYKERLKKVDRVRFCSCRLPCGKGRPPSGVAAEIFIRATVTFRRNARIAKALVKFFVPGSLNTGQ